MSMMMREEHDKALDALSKQWATFGDRLVDRGYPSHLRMAFHAAYVRVRSLVHQKGKDSAWQDIKQLADDYFGGLSPEEEAFIRRGNNPLGNPREMTEPRQPWGLAQLLAGSNLEVLQKLRRLRGTLNNIARQRCDWRANFETDAA
jgi:hypothetical protein